MHNPRFDYEEYLEKLSYKEQVAEVKQFFIDMMDWTQQSDEMEIYLKLHEFIEENFTCNN